MKSIRFLLIATLLVSFAAEANKRPVEAKGKPANARIAELKTQIEKLEKEGKKSEATKLRSELMMEEARTSLSGVNSKLLEIRSLDVRQGDVAEGLKKISGDKTKEDIILKANAEFSKNSISEGEKLFLRDLLALVSVMPSGEIAKLNVSNMASLFENYQQINTAAKNGLTVEAKNNLRLLNKMAGIAVRESQNKSITLELVFEEAARELKLNEKLTKEEIEKVKSCVLGRVSA